MAFYTYLLASQRNGTLYIGSTDELNFRIWEHKDQLKAGFTAKYGIHLLVWYETHYTREAAFQRERRMKKWNRAWKIALIERFNPGWRDLYEELNGLKAWVPAFAGMSGIKTVLREDQKSPSTFLKNAPSHGSRDRLYPPSREKADSPPTRFDGG